MIKYLLIFLIVMGTVTSAQASNFIWGVAVGSSMSKDCATQTRPLLQEVNALLIELGREPKYDVAPRKERHNCQAPGHKPHGTRKFSESEEDFWKRMQQP
jgi:hypothetical protein